MTRRRFRPLFLYLFIYFVRGARVLSYLPLSHIAGQMVDIYAMLALGGTTYCADNKCMKGTLPDNLQWCKPTMFFGVPRVWEKVRTFNRHHHHHHHHHNQHNHLMHHFIVDHGGHAGKGQRHQGSQENYLYES